MRAGVGLSAVLFTLIGVTGVPAPAAAASTLKLAFFNIQAGKGEVGLPGRPVLFVDTANCTDTTQPINAWGVGFVQRELVKAVKNDAAVVALGLAEAWLCGSPENVRQLLGWAAKTSTRNGLAVVAGAMLGAALGVRYAVKYAAQLQVFVVVVDVVACIVLVWKEIA